MQPQVFTIPVPGAASVEETRIGYAMDSYVTPMSLREYMESSDKVPSFYVYESYKDWDDLKNYITDFGTTVILVNKKSVSVKKEIFKIIYRGLASTYNNQEDFYKALAIKLKEIEENEDIDVANIRP